jgi:predicted ArsR family transcriptional regulator
MQETRKQILEILHDNGEATVDDIVCELEKRRGSITAVTVRHHLAKLQKGGLVTMPHMRHRATPGRPQHIYALTDQGVSFFPNNYQHITSNLIRQMQANLTDKQVNVIIEGVASSMADEAAIPNGNMPQRLVAVVDYLDQHGYKASWEHHTDGYILHMTNCPYHDVAHESDTLCRMDTHLIAKMLGVVPRLVSHISEGDDSCSYLIPTHDK